MSIERIRLLERLTLRLLVAIASASVICIVFETTPQYWLLIAIAWGAIGLSQIGLLVVDLVSGR